MKAVILFCLFTSFSHASSCFSDSSTELETTEKYKSLFEFETEIQEGSAVISIHIPVSLEGKEYVIGAVLMDSIDDPTFFIPIHATKAKNSYIVAYILSRELVRRHFVTFTYGEGCGISVTLPVVLE
ncbi:hypothetical protein JC525_11890 [Alteromonas sp. IB21]|uniref:hypothetical protein n=1 Tax=Alteromonas sp. IB21 TaxID=2779369 RepID=UPI0018E775A3|nr:hypothetical protein [Alteromonas sp. IB21]MBJ2129634.1 hypothetical protein [Alteromonas sp. IB21]